MKKTIKYSILGLAALCTVVLCGGYYMLGHAQWANQYARQLLKSRL